ncbi:hypothetical protein SUGI_0953100 [Cryptomeria japonica]|nr:hypothetical protein SUGI_0953100 [Cryptomeria japonica]
MFEIVVVDEEFHKATRNAMCVGFDDREIHARHGYLIDQFLKDGVIDYDWFLHIRCHFSMEARDGDGERV